MTANALLDMAKTASTADHTKTQDTIAYEIPPAGPTPARFIGYIEVGKQPQEYQGEAKNPALEAIMFFELNGPKHKRTVVVDGVEQTFTNRIKVSEVVSVNSKANFKKLFNAMRYDRENITHMAQMLGEPFLVTVVHNTSGEGDKKKTFANMKDANGWKIGPPVFIDPMDPDRKRAIPVPEMSQEPMLLLWDNPNKMMWDSIFIDGTRTVKDKDGEEREVSKNWIQELCLKATDFDTSPLNDMLTGIHGVVSKRIAEQEQAAEKPAEAKEEKKQEKTPVDSAAASDADDVLAALGLSK